MGNLRSVAKAIEHVAPVATVFVTSDPARCRRRRAGRVSPGQGAMPDCMRELDARGLRPAVRAAAPKSLSSASASASRCCSDTAPRATCRASASCPGRSCAFPNGMVAADGSRLKVPHMGWNGCGSAAHPLWDGIPDGARASIRAQLLRGSCGSGHAIATTDYGVPFTRR